MGNAARIGVLAEQICTLDGGVRMRLLLARAQRMARSFDRAVSAGDVDAACDEARDLLRLLASIKKLARGAS